MPQFNNISYNALQLQSNNLPNGFNEPNRTLSNNHTNAFFSFASSNAYNNRTAYNSTYSPSALNTPGRKSASPTFFHSNDSLYNRHLNNGLGNFFNSAQHIKHLNFDCFQNQFAFTNFNGPPLALSGQHDPALKIPTTPTRSKSLSPSHRCVNQPARLRHKQQNKNSKIQEQDQMSSINNDKSKLDDKKNSSNNENFCFKPIESKNEKSSNSNPSGKLASNVTENSRPKLNEKIQIKKPIPVLPICQNGPVNTLLLQSEEQNKLDNHSSSNKRIFSDQISIEKNNLLKQCDNLHTNDLSETNIQKFKLPLNARMINLNNYPPNISPVAKRQFSVIMQRVKSENVNNPDKCIQILKQNIQFIFNKEIKQLVDQFKMSFIDPAVKNFNKNKTNPKISENDMLVFVLSLIEDAKNNIFESDSENFESKFTSNDPTKRKLDSESSEDVAGSELSDESLRKKSKCLANEINLNGNQKNDKKELLFDLDSKFVLGKNVNDVFMEIQQQFYEVNSEDSNSSATLNDSINPKSIYSRFPNLFRYEADQQDRQWLNENQIIKRKNIKCNILLLDDIFELFKNNFKLTSNVVMNEKNDDNGQESNDAQDEKDLILKKLKTFSLPEFILNKLNKKYNIKNSKFIQK